jgi:F-type H+-transporting ATPase subunit b
MQCLKASAWVLLALLAAAAPAWAAEPGEQQDLVSANLDWRTAAVSVVVFLLVLVVLGKTAWKPILQGLQKREETIRKAVDEAAEASSKARSLMQDYEQRLAGAREEGQAILEAGRKDAEALRLRIEADAKRTAEETSARAKRDIEQAAAKAYDDLLQRIATITTEAAGRIIARRLDAQGHQDIVDEVVREFAGRGAGAGGGHRG